MLEKFTEKAIAVITLARMEARRLEFARVTIETLFIALLAEKTGLVPRLLAPYGINLKTARLAVERLLGRGYLPLRVDSIVFSEEVKQVLKRGIEVAQRIGSETVEPEHMLLAVLQQEHDGMASILEALCVNRQVLLQQLEAAMQGGGPEAEVPGAEEEEVVLKHYSPRLLTPAAAQVLEVTRRETIRKGHNTIGTEELLLGLVRYPHTLAGRILNRAGLYELNLLAAIERMIGSGSGTETDLLVYNHVVARVLEESWNEAKALSSRRIGTGHLLLGLLKVDESTARLLFKGSVIVVDIDPEEMRWDLERLLRRFAGNPEPLLGDLEEELHVIETEDEVPGEVDEIPLENNNISTAAP